jgi:glycosyltransferase involved in cell wall biosynthesis
MLLQRKYPDAAIRAVSRTTDDADFHFDIVGNGVMASELKTLVARLHVTEQVILHGRLPRRAILPLLDAADVFVMISASEVFGLVYLEAMARGCIVIAARNEGMTGIIDHGKNGFLCAAGDEEELITILNAIKQLTVQERQMISNKAMATAALYTDTAVSQDYLSHVMML